MFDINLGDKITTKKNHPCGCNEWVCIRTGADIKLKCKKCNHIIMLDREECQKRTKTIIKADEVK